MTHWREREEEPIGKGTRFLRTRGKMGPRKNCRISRIERDRLSCVLTQHFTGEGTKAH